MAEWIFDLDQADEGEQCNLAVFSGQARSVLVAQKHWFPDKDGSRTLRWRDTILGGAFLAPDGPWLGFTPYAFQRLSEPPTLEALDAWRLAESRITDLTEQANMPPPEVNLDEVEF